MVISRYHSRGLLIEPNDNGRRAGGAFIQAQHDAALSHQSSSSAVGVLPGPVETAGRVALEVRRHELIARLAHRVDDALALRDEALDFWALHLDSCHVTVMPHAHLREAQCLDGGLGRIDLRRLDCDLVPWGSRGAKRRRLVPVGRPRFERRLGSRAFQCRLEHGKRTPRRIAEPWPERWRRVISVRIREVSSPSFRARARLVEEIIVKESIVRVLPRSVEPIRGRKSTKGAERRASTRASSCSASGYAGELARAPTAPSPSSSMASRSSRVESTPPE